MVCEDLFHAKSQSQVVVNGCGRGGVAVLPVLPCGPRTQIQNSYNTVILYYCNTVILKYCNTIILPALKYKTPIIL